MLCGAFIRMILFAILLNTGSANTDSASICLHVSVSEFVLSDSFLFANRMQAGNIVYICFYPCVHI